jgi:saccharopine dehydrogenase-like NADP-dependent oxidoreductase
MNTVEQIEKEVMTIEKDRAKAAAANNAAIEAEANRKYFDTEKQAAVVDVLKAKRDAVLLAYDKISERKAVELATARASMAALQAKQDAAQEKQAAKAKERARIAFLQAGGLPGEFESQWLSIVSARTVNKLDEPKKRVSIAF